MPASSRQAGVQGECCCWVHEHLVHDPSCHPREEKMKCQGLLCTFLVSHHRGPKPRLSLGWLRSPTVRHILKLTAFHTVWEACLLLFLSSAGHGKPMELFLKPLLQRELRGLSMGGDQPVGSEPAQPIRVLRDTLDVPVATGGGKMIPQLCKCRTVSSYGHFSFSVGSCLAPLSLGGSIPGPGVALGGAEGGGGRAPSRCCH